MKKTEYAYTNVSEAIQKSIEVVKNGGTFISAFEIAGLIYVTVEEAEREPFKGVEVDVAIVDELTEAASNTAAKATTKRGKK